MSNKYSLSAELSEIVTRLARKNWGLGRTFKYLRGLSMAEHLFDLGLFRFAVIEYRRLEKKLTEKSINYHFNRRVSASDYEGVSKRKILHDLYHSNC